MEQKISAKELWDVVTDTNAKVSELASKRTKVSGEKKPVSKIGTAVDIILLILGAALIVNIFFPKLLDTLHLSFLTGNVFKWIYLCYAIKTVLIATLTKVKIPVKLLTVLIGIAPMTITLILSIV